MDPSQRTVASSHTDGLGSIHSTDDRKQGDEKNESCLE